MVSELLGVRDQPKAIRFRRPIRRPQAETRSVLLWGHALFCHLKSEKLNLMLQKQHGLVEWALGWELTPGFYSQLCK